MNFQVLVLNKSFCVIGTISFKKAIVLLYNDKAKVLETDTYRVYDWYEWAKMAFDKYAKIKTPQKSICVPEIVVLKSYDKVRVKRIKPNKKNIYKRDAGLCQYCGIFLSFKDSTIDHINAKSKNGKFTWDNCVLSCVKCNLRKSNYDLKEIGMKLIRTPEVPNYEKINFPIDAPISWKLFFK